MAAGDSAAQGGSDLISTNVLTTVNGGAVSGIEAQRVKVGFGEDGALWDASGTFPLPVNVAWSMGTVPSVTQALSVAGAATITGSASTTSAAVIDVSKMGNVSFSLSATAFVGTVTFEQSFDPAGGANTWLAVNVLPEAGSAPSTAQSINTATAWVAQYTRGMFGAALFRVRVSAYTSGTLTALLKTGPGWIKTQPALAPSGAQIGTVVTTGAQLTAGAASGNVFAARANPTTAATTVLQAAPAAGLSLYVTDVSVSNAGATLNTVSLLPTAGTAVLDIVAAASGGGGSMNFRTPIKLTAATGLSMTTSAASSTFVTVTGYVAP